MRVRQYTKCAVLSTTTSSAINFTRVVKLNLTILLRGNLSHIPMLLFTLYRDTQERIITKSPQQTSVMIFQKKKTDAESYLGTSIIEAVMNVPDNFE